MDLKVHGESELNVNSSFSEPPQHSDYLIDLYSLNWSCMNIVLTLTLFFIPPLS